MADLLEFNRENLNQAIEGVMGALSPNGVTLEIEGIRHVAVPEAAARLLLFGASALETMMGLLPPQVIVKSKE